MKEGGGGGKCQAAQQGQKYPCFTTGFTVVLYTMEGRYCTFVPPLLLLHSCFRWK